MRVSAILLARAVALVESYDLNPFGRVFYPDLIKALVERYRFSKFPTEFKDVDEQKGVEFFAGKWGEDVIDRLAIFSTGIVLDTRSNTSVSRRLIEEALEWGKSKLGLAYDPDLITHFAHVSQLTFYSDITLNALHPALSTLADRVGRVVSEAMGERIDYQTSAIVVQHDPLIRKDSVAGFTIQPRAGVPFSERKYFSEAPLSTDLHVALLKDFEAAIISSD